jgi:hypothetical protein
MHDIVVFDLSSDKSLLSDFLFHGLFIHLQDVRDLLGGEDRRV